MSTENPQPKKPSFFQNLKNSSGLVRRFLMADLLILIIIALIATYHHWQTPKEDIIASNPPTFAPPNAPTENLTSNQNLLAEQLQKTVSSYVPVAEHNSILHSLNNQIAIIQLLLSNQQYPAALNLLNALENEAVLLPTDAQSQLQSAIERDRENIQKTQAAAEQLSAQLQQLEHYLNQQLLQRLSLQKTTTVSQTETIDTSNMPWTTAIWEKTKHLLAKGIKVERNATTISEPNFYTAIMMQLALQRAQFALDEGDWTEYQFTLSSLNAWVNTDLLNWIPDASGMINTLNNLAEQTSPFINANVNNTQTALNQLMQET